MTEKQREIMKTFGALVPMLTELEQEKLLSFSEGMAFMLAEQARERRSGRPGRRGSQYERLCRCSTAEGG